MSGGAYNYAYQRIADLALEIRARAGRDPKRLTFARLLDAVAKAARDIEWVDSGDTGPDGADESIAEAIAFGGADPSGVYRDEAIAACVEILRAAGYEVRP